MAFKVGQKVVCISRASNWHLFDGCQFPVVSEVYTIRDIGPSYAYNHGIPCIRVTELHNPLFGGAEPNFKITRFRPVAERKTDISIFEKMLVPKRQHEPAGAVLTRSR